MIHYLPSALILHFGIYETLNNVSAQQFVNQKYQA